MVPVFGNVVLLLVVVDCACGLRAVPTCGGYSAKVIVIVVFPKVAKRAHSFSFSELDCAIAPTGPC